MLIGNNISNRNFYVIISLTAAASFIFLNKQLWFFDEDVFVVTKNSIFMQQSWQRAYLVKQLLKIQNYFFGKNPFGYHVVSSVLHVFNSLVTVLLFKKLLHYYQLNIASSDRLFYACFLLFLVTPVHSEPLSYLLAQGILVFSLFAQASIFFFIKALSRKIFSLLLSLLFFTLSLFCYEISWILPVVFLFIVLFSAKNKTISKKNGLIFSSLFFLLLSIFLTVKYFFVSKVLVADYGGITLESINFLSFFRNTVVLFIRNFVTPFNNSIFFAIAAVILVSLIGWVLYKSFTKDKKLFAFLSLLILLILLSVSPAALFGIDTHDSESERYIYFSSVFAIMFIAVALETVVSSTQAKNTVTTVTCLLFIVLLYNTLNNYHQASRFSTQYIKAVAQQAINSEKVYLINQPSQYKGALMVRALSRLPNLTQNHHTVINEYMQYLYGNTKTEFITVSKKEVAQPSVFLKLMVKPIDSAAYYFAESDSISKAPIFKKKEDIITGLHNDTLFVFR